MDSTLQTLGPFIYTAPMEVIYEIFNKIDDTSLARIISEIHNMKNNGLLNFSNKFKNISIQSHVEIPSYSGQYTKT